MEDLQAETPRWWERSEASDRTGMSWHQVCSSTDKYSVPSGWAEKHHNKHKMLNLDSRKTHRVLLLSAETRSHTHPKWTVEDFLPNLYVFLFILIYLKQKSQIVTADFSVLYCFINTHCWSKEFPKQFLYLTDYSCVIFFIQTKESSGHAHDVYIYITGAFNWFIELSLRFYEVIKGRLRLPAPGLQNAFIRNIQIL